MTNLPPPPGGWPGRTAPFRDTYVHHTSRGIRAHGQLVGLTLDWSTVASAVHVVLVVNAAVRLVMTPALLARV